MERFGQYILLEKVATGGMAELYKAMKVGIEGFERVLAIKKILPHLSSDEEFINMFIAEAKLVARLNHKNIVQVYDFGKTGQDYFIAMEYIRGKDLKAILKRCREWNMSFPVAPAVFIAKEIAAALSHAHGQKDSTGKNLNIIHRDVSPQNILISYEGEVKVVDFGIAKAEAHSKTATGTLKGKLSYMSPEQAWGRPVDQRSDIFSLGIVFYEMLTGEKLFKGDSEINTLEKVREARVEPMASSINVELPAELEAKMLKMLARETASRYQNALDIEVELGSIIFKLIPDDPAMSVKQFMRELFASEIEAEHKSEMKEKPLHMKIEAEAEIIQPDPPPVPEKPKYEAKEPPPFKERPLKSRPYTGPQPRKWRGCSCLIFSIITLVVLTGGIMFMFPEYKAKVTPYALDAIAKIKNIYHEKMGTPGDKSLIQEKPLPRNFIVNIKQGRTLFWNNYFEEGDNYCTNESYGKVCIAKEDIVSIKIKKDKNE